MPLPESSQDEEEPAREPAQSEKEPVPELTPEPTPEPTAGDSSENVAVSQAYTEAEALLTGETAFIERGRNLLSQMEETVITGKADDGMNIRLLQIKKLLLKRYNYYDQLLDVASTLVENENGVFAPKGLSCLTNLAARVTRLRSDVDTLSDSADHLQDAYSASLDMKLNRSMQFLTVLTTVFFPLTIIVGWYGMNFEHMPEFGWKYGYLYVIVLSAVVVSALYLIGKKRKWF